MRIGIAGPSHIPYSESADSQRSANLFSENVGPLGKARVVLYGTPGLKRRVNLADGAGVKTIFYDTTTRRVFTVKLKTDGSVHLSELTTTTILADTETDRGLLLSAAGTMVPTCIISNGTQLLIICPEASKAFLFVLASNTLTDITSSVGEGEPRWGAFQDGYFIALDANGKFYLSSINDGATWDATDVATPEASPDSATMLVSDGNHLWIFGPESVELWRNSGRVDSPFEPVKHLTFSKGLLYTYSVAMLNDRIFWVTRHQSGGAVVVDGSDYRGRVVSNHAVANALQSTGITGAAPVAWGHQHMGHFFYVLTFPDDGMTWAYDVGLDPVSGWHERFYLAGDDEEAHRARCCEFVGGEEGAAKAHLVGDRANGKIYVLDMDTYSDDGEPIRRVRRAQHLSNEMNRIAFHELELDVEQGVGRAEYNLRFSNNGGKLFSAARAVTANSAKSVWEVTAASPSAAGGGDDYEVGDVLEVTTGVGDAAKLLVTEVDTDGSVVAASIYRGGKYTTQPDSMVNPSGGSGTNASVELTFKRVNADVNPVWRKLGSGRDRVFEIYSDAAVKHVWLDGYLDATPGTS